VFFALLALIPILGFIHDLALQSLQALVTAFNPAG
jgi:hypothetical protein